MLQLEPNFDKLAPTKRTERFGDPSLGRNIVDLLLKTCSKLNILREVKGSLHSAASGINNYIRFRRLARRPCFPVAEGAVKIPLLLLIPVKPLKCTWRTYRRHAYCLTYQPIGYLLAF